jgi:hypothetical protein
MAVPTNILEQVITYQESSLALLVNQNPWIATANKKFNNFDQFAGNLGSTVSFDLPPRFVTNQTLVATFQGSEQRVQNLTVDQAENVSYAFDAQQFIFNVDEYMDKFGRSAIAELGSSIGSNIAENAVSHTYRAFNAPAIGSTTIAPINSYQQYAQVTTVLQTQWLKCMLMMSASLQLLVVAYKSLLLIVTTKSLIAGC